jgi:hypothetical protein
MSISPSTISSTATKTISNHLPSLSHVLDIPVARFPGKDILRYELNDVRWTTSTLRKHSRAVGAGLYQFGINKENPNHGIFVHLPNNVERITLQLGAALAGSKMCTFEGPLLSTSTTLQSIKPEIFAIAVKTSASRMVTVGNTMGEIHLARKALKIPDDQGDSLGLPITKEEFPALRFAMHTGQLRENWFMRFRDCLAYFPIPDPLEPPASNGVILETYDTSSGKKNKEYTLSQLLQTAKKSIETLKLTPDDRVLLSSSGSSYAVLVSCLASVESCAQLIIPDQTTLTDAGKMKQLMEVEKITAVVGDVVVNHGRFYQV